MDLSTAVQISFLGLWDAICQGASYVKLFSTCDREWDVPFPSLQTIQSPVSSHISHSASSDACLILGLIPHLLWDSSPVPLMSYCVLRQLKKWSVLWQDIPSQHLVSVRKISAKARSDLVSYPGVVITLICINAANMCYSSRWTSPHLTAAQC